MMRSTTQLLLGPAGAGKTERALARYIGVLDAAAPAKAVWLAPSSRAARQIRARIADRCTRAATLNPGVHTFATLAEAVLRSARLPVTRLGPLEKRALLRELIGDAVAAGKLRYFAPIADTAGLVDLISQFVAEWKRLEIWPEELREAAVRRGATRKDQELSLLYEQYQAILAQHDWYDGEGLIWLARALLRDGQAAPFPRLDLFVVDGFSDFTRTEHEILELLAARAAEFLVTLPDDPGDERADLFAKARRTADQLRRRHPAAETVRLERHAAVDWPALAHLERRLFGHPRRVVDADDVRRVEIFAAGRELGEVEWIAERVKRLLVEGDAEFGRPVRPEEVVVVYRSLESVAPLVRETFARYGIPYYIETTRRLLDVPIVAALLQLARLHAEDWPYRLLLAVWNQDFLQPTWPAWRDDAIAEAERLVRTAQVPRGREAILQGCRSLAALRQAALSEAEDEAALRERARIVAAVSLLEQFGTKVSGWPVTGDAAIWLSALLETAKDLGYERQLSIEDRVALNALTEAAASLARLDALLGKKPSLSAAEFFDWLQEVVASSALPQEHDEVGRVRVLSAASVRAVEAPYLFVAGLSERSFPAGDSDQRVYSESERRALSAAGLPLVLRDERAQEEMLLFYETLTRASRRLYLSYPAMDDRAQPLSPSPYLTEVERAFGNAKLPRGEAIDLSPLPRNPVVWNARDWRLRAVLECGEGKVTALAGLLSSVDAQSVAGNLLAGLNVVRERSVGEGFGPFEGVFHTAGAKRACQESFGVDRVWSATDLELYGACPYRFLLSSVLNLQAIEEIELGADYRGRGARMHQALATLHRTINMTHAAGTAPHALATDVYEELVRRLLADLERAAADDGSLRAALLEIERKELAEWLAAYAEQHAAYETATGMAQMKPLYFEAAFGMRSKRREDEPARDELSVEECLELRRGDDVVRIAGRIDRIDVAEVDGQAVFNVLDYKTGKPPSGKEIAAGAALQLPLYALAAERLLLKDHHALPWQFGYWSVAEKGFKEGAQLADRTDVSLAPTQTWTDLLNLIERNVFAMVGALRRGEFPMFSREKDCTARCDFRRVCRVNQVRSLEKRWEASPPPPPG